LDTILKDIKEEIRRQDEKWRGGNRQMNDEWSLDRGYVILLEEVGEVAKSILEKDNNELYKECVQSATILMRLAAMSRNLDFYEF